MRVVSTFTFLLLIIFFTSCKTQRLVENTYLYHSRDSLTRSTVAYTPPLIQTGDLLSIRVFSKANGLDQKADAPYNLQELQGGGGGSNNLPTFLVDRNGNIEYPQLGTLHVEGLTREDLSQFIKSKLDTALINPSVVVRFQNFKITILGEVRAPGSYTFPTENVTILEALGQSGDISEYGKKDNVIVIRQENGAVERGRINLTSDSLFSSPYFYLQQRDVVLVEATQRRYREREQQNVLQQVGVGTTIVTAIALILNFIK